MILFNGWRILEMLYQHLIFVDFKWPRNATLIWWVALAVQCCQMAIFSWDLYPSLTKISQPHQPHLWPNWHNLLFRSIARLTTETAASDRSGRLAVSVHKVRQNATKIHPCYRIGAASWTDRVPNEWWTNVMEYVAWAAAPMRISRQWKKHTMWHKI